MKRHLTLLAATLAAVLVVGCGLPSLDQGGAAPTTTAPPGGDATIGGGGNGGGGDGGADDPNSLEGKFDHAQMKDYLNLILPSIENWMGADFPDLPLPRQVVYVPSGYQGPEGCQDANGDAEYTSESYEYCGADDIVYIGQDFIWQLYTDTGDAGPAVGLAHEFGHHVQDERGVPDPRTDAESVQHEDQADCLAGAWAKYARAQGTLQYPDDLQDINSLFPLIGSAEGPDQDHGTATDRRNSFNEGFSGGPTACDAFYPATPVA